MVEITFFWTLEIQQSLITIQRMFIQEKLLDISIMLCFNMYQTHSPVLSFTIDIKTNGPQVSRGGRWVWSSPNTPNSRELFNERRMVFSRRCAGRTGFPHSKEWSWNLTPYIKINSKCIIDLNIRAKIMQLLDEHLWR